MDQILQNGNSITVIGLLLIAIVTGSKGMWSFRFQTDAEIKRLEQQIADLEERSKNELANLRKDYEQRLEERQRDLEEWKEFALQATDLGKRATDVAQKTVQR